MTMPIPSLDGYGLLPCGVHDCSLHEVRAAFGGSDRRRYLCSQLEWFVSVLRSIFAGGDLLVDGSFVTDKPVPGDIEVTIDLRLCDSTTQASAFKFWLDHNVTLKADHEIHFFPTLQANSDFTSFFQYVGEKTAAMKGLDKKHPKGILRIVP